MRVIEFAKNGSEFGGQNLFHVWRIGSTSQLRGINLKDLQPQSGIYKEKIEKLKCLAAWHGLETHGGGWGKAKLDKLDKSGALQGGTVRVRASRSWARPAPRSEFFYLIGRAADRPVAASPGSAPASCSKARLPVQPAARLKYISYPTGYRRSTAAGSHAEKVTSASFQKIVSIQR